MNANRILPRTLFGFGASILLSACGAPDPGDTSVARDEALTLGSTYTLVRKTAKKCVDIAGGSTANGTQIQQWTCNGSGAQSFVPQDAGGGKVKLVSPASSKCLDISASGTADGTKVQLWTCNGTAAQSFGVEDLGAGFSRLRNLNSGKCLDVNANGLADGVKVQLWTCNGSDAQSFVFTPVVTTPPPAGDMYQACVDKINALRATIGMAPLARWTDNETCANGQSQSDGLSGKAHGAFSACPNWAQNECPGWPSQSSIYSGANSCLDMMWAEGPGEPYEAHGHYLNMTNPSYTKVSCGFYTTANGKVWSVQDFR